MGSSEGIWGAGVTGVHADFLVFENVSLKASMGSHFLLKNLSFHVQRGDRLSLVGASGSGKTSLLRLINRLSEPSDGAIYLDGQSIRQMPVMQLRYQVPLVLQESKLLDMTVGDSLVYPLHIRKLAPTAIRDRLEKWTTRLGIPQNWMERTEVQLSVGQRQLVAIARALMIEPRLLLLDEPTSALDIGHSRELIQLFHHLSATENMTFIMANHDLPLVQKFCTRVIALEEGKLWLNESNLTANWHDIRERITGSELQAATDWGDDVG